MLRSWLLLLAACSVEDATPTTPAAPIPDAVDVCATAVRVEVPTPSVLPRTLVQIRAWGGSGQVQWALVEDRTGAELNPETGAYLSGRDRGSDTVRVTDTLCGHVATGTVTVVDPLQVSPRRARLRSGTSLTPTVAGGSGQSRCELLEDRSGAGLDGCAYTAGEAEGQDTLRITDTETGEVVDVWLEVARDAALRVEGQGGLWIPLGSTARLSPVNGSGIVEATLLQGEVDVAGDTLTATTTTDGRIGVRDVYTGETLEVPVHVVAPHLPTAPRDGERSGTGTALRLGDVDGDGYDDVALGFIEISMAAHYAGAVAIYGGGPDGLRPQPVMTVTGREELDTLGRALALADVNHDGHDDLLIGADKVDQGFTNNGEIRILAGRDGTWFDDVPMQLLRGEQSYERLGTALAPCDFDGDGFVDLAAGAVESTDRNVGDPSEDQGGVYVYRGSAQGFGERPDFILHGVVPTADGWRGKEDLGLGEALAAGDFDGDGLCDLAAGAPEGSADGDDDDGYVALYRGTTASGLVLTRTPVRAIVPTDGHDELGRRLAAGDLDGDGRAELVVSRWKADDHASDSGSVYIFSGSTLFGPGDRLTTADATWRAHGTRSGDQLGSDLDLYDLDADGALDLLVGAYKAEDGESNQGMALAFTRLASQLTQGGDFTGRADRTWAGHTRDGRFGQAVSAAGDVDGDGLVDVFGLAGYADDFGVEAGAPVAVDGASGGTTVLDLPGRKAGHDYGHAMLLADTDGDGLRELLVGAPGAGDPLVGANAGVVDVWSDVGVRPLLGGHADHSGSDRLGQALATADFDGDGYRDLVVLARSDARPSSFGASYANPDQCPGYRSLAGSALVFLGDGAGFDTTPAFVAHGPVASGTLQDLAIVDHDGDGRDDIALASTSWGTEGGLAIVHGRAADPRGTRVLCDEDLVTYRAHDDFDRLGASIAALGDLDGDGCEDVGIGATGEELSSSWFNQGTLRVFWGHGAPGCADEAEVTTLAIQAVGTGLGASLAGGRDVDGDGVSDIVIGGATHRVQFAEHGVVWVVPGNRVRDLPRQSLSMGLPTPQDTRWHLLFSNQGLRDRMGVIGPTAGSLFGASVALVADPDATHRSLIAVGQPQGAVGGTPLSGGVALYRFDDAAGGLDPVPWMLVAGESESPGALGASVSADQVDGRPVLLVGAPSSDAAGLDVGAAYRIAL